MIRQSRKRDPNEGFLYTSYIPEDYLDANSYLKYVGR